MHFEISHEFDAPLDVVELALMSPDLGRLLADRFAQMESVEPIEHVVDGRQFRRVWRFQAKVPLKALQGYRVPRDLLNWDEHSSYRLDDHSGQWNVVPRADANPDAAWRKRFRAAGTSHLAPLEDGRTRRTVVGELEVSVKVVGSVLERGVLLELRKAYDAEADALRALCALA
ncbi:MAG: DUF2505 family protein [Deltaproteobacteria bacterium]|nr:DUF2505 family protein [Deltaproteobacteria bacterium]